MRLIVVANFGARRIREGAGDWLDIQEKIHIFEIYNGVHLLRELPRAVVFLAHHFIQVFGFWETADHLGLKEMFLLSFTFWSGAKGWYGNQVENIPSNSDSLRFSPPDGHWFRVFPRQTLVLKPKWSEWLGHRLPLLPLRVMILICCSKEMELGQNAGDSESWWFWLRCHFYLLESGHKRYFAFHFSPRGVQASSANNFSSVFAVFVSIPQLKSTSFLFTRLFKTTSSSSASSSSCYNVSSSHT